MENINSCIRKKSDRSK